MVICLLMTAERVSNSMSAAQSGPTLSGGISDNRSDGIYARILDLKLRQLRGDSVDTAEIAALEKEHKEAEEEEEEARRVAAEAAKRRTAQQTQQAQEAQRAQQIQQTQARITLGPPESHFIP